MNIFGTVNISRMEKKKDINGLLDVLSRKWDKHTIPAIQALARIRDQGTIAPLISMLLHIDVRKLILNKSHPIQHYDVGKQIMDSLKMFGATAIEPLISMLAPNKNNTETIVWVLGELKDNRAAKPLFNILKNDKRKYVREAAAIQLSGLVWEPETIDEKVYYHVIRNEMQNCLEMGNVAIPALEEILEQYWDSKSLGVALNALVGIGEMRDIEYIAGLLDDGKSTETRISAIQALGKLGNDQAVTILKKTFADTSESIQREVIIALGNTKNALAVEPLILILSDMDHTKGYLAAGALASIGESAVEPLIHMLSRDARSITHELSRKAKLADPSNDPSVAFNSFLYLSVQVDSMRRFAADTLGLIGDARAVAVLEKVLTDNDEVLRINAHQALEKIKELNEAIKSSTVYLPKNSAQQ